MHRSRNARENGITARTYANTRRRIRAHIKKLALSPSAPSVFSNVSVPSGAFGLSSSVSSGAFSSSGPSVPPVFTFSVPSVPSPPPAVPSVPSFSFQNGPSDPPVRPTVFGNYFGLSSSSSTFVPSFSFGSLSSSSPSVPSFSSSSPSVPAAPAASEEIKIIKPSSPGGEICFSRYSESCSELIHSSDDSDSDTWCSDTPMSPSSSSAPSSSPAFVSNTPLDDDQVKLHERYLAMRRNALTGPLPSDHLPGFLTPLVSCPAGQQEDTLLFVNWYSGNFRSSPPPSSFSSRRLARIMSPSESCWDEAFVETVRSLLLFVCVCVCRRVCAFKSPSLCVCLCARVSFVVCVCVHSPSSFSATTSSSGTSSSTNSTNSPNPVFAPSSPTPHPKPSTNSSKTHSPSYPPNHGTTTHPCSSSSATSPPNTSPTNSSSMHALPPCSLCSLFACLFDSTLSLSCCVL